jgi:Asp-tRNA(Asn)/Glu-tRNA(Gln) amidotransferase A subunit family amidase
MTRPFHWPAPRDLATLRVGFFESRSEDAERPELDVLAELGVQLVPIKLPDTPSANAISVVLNIEAATIFDELLRTNDVEGLNRWPNAWRQAQFVPAVEYLRANRARTLLMQEMEKLFDDVDLYVGGNDLVITNLTGHPSVVMPNGFRQREDVTLPTSITFTGRLFGESSLLAVAHAYQRATGHHLQRPALEQFETEMSEGDE